MKTYKEISTIKIANFIVENIDHLINDSGKNNLKCIAELKNTFTPETTYVQTIFLDDKYEFIFSRKSTIIVDITIQILDEEKICKIYQLLSENDHKKEIEFTFDKKINSLIESKNSKIVINKKFKYDDEYNIIEMLDLIKNTKHIYTYEDDKYIHITDSFHKETVSSSCIRLKSSNIIFK